MKRDLERTKPGRAAPRIAVRWVPVEALIPDPRNARLHPEGQVRRIADSIAAFGFNVPVLIDGDSRVVAGHGRVLAARRLGLSEIPAIILDHLSEAERRAFMIADNRLAESASWDMKRRARGGPPRRDRPRKRADWARALSRRVKARGLAGLGLPSPDSCGSTRSRAPAAAPAPPARPRRANNNATTPEALAAGVHGQGCIDLVDETADARLHSTQRAHRSHEVHKFERVMLSLSRTTLKVSCPL
jgi:ParB-like nuclease domain